jgi:hypothetical protein
LHLLQLFKTQKPSLSFISQASWCTSGLTSIQAGPKCLQLSSAVTSKEHHPPDRLRGSATSQNGLPKTREPGIRVSVHSQQNRTSGQTLETKPGTELHLEVLVGKLLPIRYRAFRPPACSFLFVLVGLHRQPAHNRHSPHPDGPLANKKRTARRTARNFFLSRSTFLL